MRAETFKFGPLASCRHIPTVPLQPVLIPSSSVLFQGTSSRAPTCRAHTPNPAPLARPRCSVTALHATDSPPSPAGNEQFSFRSTPIACCAAVRTAYGAPSSAHQMHCSSARLKRTAQPGRGLTATALLPHGARRNKSVNCALPAIQRRAAARTVQASHDEESHSRADLQRELVRIRSFQEIERACRVTGKCGPLTKVSSPKRTACREAVLICCKSSKPMESV